MEPPVGSELEFHRWYEEDHIPARMVLPGFAGATRWVAIQGQPAFLAVYDLADLAELETPEYQRLKSEPSAETARMLGAARGFTRYICEETSDTGPTERTPSFLSVVAFDVPPADEGAFDDWYDSEHIPALLRGPSWLRVRRLRVLSGDGGSWTRLTLHELGCIEAMWSAERAAARNGPKRAALSDRPWFRSAGRWVYRSLTRHAGAGSRLMDL
jgi:hypothetical protein